MLLVPELRFQDWHHLNKHHRTSNTTSHPALPAASKGHSGDRTRTDDATRPCTLPATTQPCHPGPPAPLSPPGKADEPCAHRSLFTSQKAHPGTPGAASIAPDPALRAELLRSPKTPKRIFAPADALKIIILQANTERSHPRR